MAYSLHYTFTQLRLLATTPDHPMMSSKLSTGRWRVSGITVAADRRLWTVHHRAVVPTSGGCRPLPPAATTNHTSRGSPAATFRRSKQYDNNNEANVFVTKSILK